MRWSVAVAVASLCLLGGAGASVSAPATNEVARLTLDDCIRIGLARSAVALNATRDRAIAETLVTQARSEALPQLGIEGSYIRLDEVEQVTVGDDTYEAGTLDNYKLGAQASQLLYSGGRVRAALRAARLSETYADWAMVETLSGLVRDIRRGFHNVLLAARSVVVLQEELALLEAQSGEIELKFKSGAVSELDLLSAQVAAANARPSLIIARNAHTVALEDLKRILNVDAFQIEPVGELQERELDGGLEDYLALAEEHRARLQQVQAGVMLREQDVIVARSGLLPDLRALLSYNGANSYGFVSYEDEWQWHWNAGVALNWQIMDAGLTRGRVRQKKLELAKSETDLAELHKAVALEARTAYLDFQSALEALDGAKGTVSVAEKALRIAQSRYDAGLVTRLELTDATLAQSRARLTWYRALHAGEVALSNLRFACGLDDFGEEKEVKP